MRYLYVPILLLSTFAFANESLNIEDDFLKSLTLVNKVATNTKLNRDRTTSLINVLYGKKLQKLGVDNVYEALRYIPGIELAKEASGVKSVIFRGSITKGEVKFMVDGVEINNAYRASFYYFLDFPIELISRIEVLRGPGSILHGSGAISGVINIITKSSQNTHTANELFISGGDYKYGKGGTRFNIVKEKYKISVDAYYQKDDKEIDNSDQRFEDYSVGLNFKANDFEVNARIKDSSQGNAYGVFGSKDTDENKYENENLSIYTSIKYKTNLSKTNELSVDLNYNEYTQKLSDHSSVIETNFAPLTGDLSNNYSEESYTTKLKLLNTSIENNKLLIGAEYKHSHSIKTDLSGYPNKSNIVEPNSKRNVYSIYFSNNYLLTDSINLSLGWRYDDYSDFGDNFSPDLGIVYRATDNMSFKLKYAHAFRAPSWTELYGLSGNSNLEAEVSQNTEFGMVYRHSSTIRTSLNAYHIYIDNYIQKIGSTYQQNSELNLIGAEFDFSYTPQYNMELNFISSYTDARDKNDNRVGFVANFLTTTSLLYTSENGLIFGSTLRYTNSKDMNNDPIFDQSISYNYKDINFKFTVENLFNSGIIYYDSTHNENNPIKDAGRLALIKASMEF
ncbi:MAG: TonB-dependent receptor [Thiovulaceae bacterium]|nr:TonB-dependent receptor [Sulfurimonadaceae bacterium]